MQNLILTLISLVLTGLISGCGNGATQFIVPQARFDFPETVGSSQINVSLQSERDQLYVVFSEDADQPIDNQKPILSKNEVVDSEGDQGTKLPLNLGYGVADRLEVGYIASPDPTYTAKYMFLGNPQSSAKMGDYAAAISIRKTFAGFSAGKGDIVDLGISLGYRPDDALLLYAGYYRKKFDYELYVKNPDIEIVGGKFGTLDQRGLCLGALVQHAYFRGAVEINNADIQVQQSTQRESFFNFYLGMVF